MSQKTNLKSLFDFSVINENNKLIFIVYSSGILACLLLLPKDILDQNYFSCLTDIFVIAGLGAAMYLYFRKQLFFYGHLLATVTTAVGISLASVFEGLSSGTFIFFMPLMFAIPFVISRHKDYQKLVYVFYPTTAFFFFLTLTISPQYPYLQDITVEEATYNMVLNSFISFFLIMVCSIVFLLAEKKYIDAIQKRKRIAIEERDARTTILSNLGHELRTQINSINGTTQLILEESSLLELDSYNNFIRYTETLKYCNDQMLVLVNDILDLHKIETKKLELSPSEHNTFKLVNNVCLPFEIKHGKFEEVQIVKNIDVNLSGKNMVLDGPRLTQVLHNLLSNALKFTKQGKVEFSVKCMEESDSEYTIFFGVKDTGIGIAPENYQKIFKSFIQINNPDYKPLYSGTGLGLSIAQSIVEQMGGKIELESEPNAGSNFFFTLNLAKVPNKRLNQAAEAHNIENFRFLSGKNILLADDNPISILYTKKLLEKYGVNVQKASNGAEAVELASYANSLDLVLLDLEMPVMTGFEAIERIKKINPMLKVIAFTANIPGGQLKNRLSGLGFHDIISKPFKKEEIMQVLKSSLDLETYPPSLDFEHNPS